MNWMKRFLLTCLLAFTPVLGAAQTLVNCAPATPCTMAGPSNTNTGDRAWLAFGKINTDLLVLAPLFNSTGLPFTLPVTSGGTGTTTLTGLIKGNGTSPFSAATSADVISRWTGTCNATTFLRADGSCQATGAGVLGYDTPLQEGAVGNGVANDTTPVQTCVTTKRCFLPGGYNFKVTPPVAIPNQGILAGAGPTSILTGSAVNGHGVVEIGDGGATVIQNAVAYNFSILGTATNAVRVNNASGIFVDKVWAESITGYASPVWTDAYYFDWTFGDSLTNLSTAGAIVGSTNAVATFTASVGGATTGTLTVALVNGKYDFVFSNGERRPVTISGAGTTVVWSTALTAGTVTTAWYGSCFWVGSNFNQNVADSWTTGGTQAMAYGVYLSDDLSEGSSLGSTFSGINGSGAVIGLYVGANHRDHTFNSVYTENVGKAIVLGNYELSHFPVNLTFNSPVVGGPGSGNQAYALRIACLEIDYAYGTTFNSPDFSCAYGIDQQAPLTFSGGGASTQATGYGLVNAAGHIVAAVAISPGVLYTSNPTVVVGGSGSSGAVTAVQAGGIITTANLTVSNQGTNYNNAPPVPVRYNAGDRNTIISPYFNSGSTGTNGSLWPFVARGPNASGSGLNIVNDTATQYSGNLGAAPASLVRVGGAYGYTHWLSYLTGTGPQGTPPTTNWVLVIPPAFP